MTDQNIPHKTCITCNLSKPLADFWKDKSFKDGYCSRCIDCKRPPTIKAARCRELKRKRIQQSTDCPAGKFCYKCEQAKPLTEFTPNRAKADGLSDSCKQCNLIRNRAFAKTPEGIALRKRMLENKPNWPSQSFNAQRRYRLRYRYGITTHYYDELFQSQDGRCAICNLSQSEKPLFVDHDHQTGAVRGLLCKNCNAGIGHMKESPDLMVAAIGYLEKHKTIQQSLPV